MPPPPATRRPPWYTGGVDALLTIVGAGPAGLSLARELQRRGLRPALLERGRVGETWARQYQGLRLHSLARASSLPGMPWRGTVGPFPSAEEMVAYLRAYARRFDLDVHEGVTVEAAERSTQDDPPRYGWRLRTDRGPWVTRRLVMTTGIWSAPVEPALPGRDGYEGRVLHVSAYRDPVELAGARVLVVGVGNSGKDVALAAVRVGASATLAVRDGALFVPYPNAITQHAGAILRRLPPRLADALLRRVRRQPDVPGLRWPDRPPTAVYPVVGLELLDAVRCDRVRVRPAIVAFTPSGARFADGSEDAFDVIVLCTGYRPALDPVASHLCWGDDGLPLTDDTGFRALGAAGLYLLGYRYPTLETWLQRLRREAPAAAAVIAADMRAAADERPAADERSTTDERAALDVSAPPPRT